MFPSLFHRNSRRRQLLIEFNPHQLLVAGISRTEQGPAVVNCAAEFDRNDDTGLRQWLETNSFKQKSWMPAICGYVPSEGLLQRETVNPRKLAAPGHLAEVVREEYKIENPEAWTFQVLSPLEGTPLPLESTARPALICGISNSEVHRVQQRLLDHRLMPVRLEPSLLPLFGAVFDYMARQSDKRSAVVVIIGEEQTVAYILGKEGVHTPSPVRHGFRSILQAARRELGLAEDADVRGRLRLPGDEARLRAPKFLRALGRDLKPVIDSYEMSTGQPAGGIYCAYLPPDLAWLADPLAKLVERPSIAIDCNEWLPIAGLQAGAGVPPFGPHWLGALSLMAEFPGAKSEDASQQNDPSQGPWHADYKLAGGLPSNQFVGRRFVTGTIAVALAAFTVTLTVWQLYVSRSLRADMAYWEAEMAKNQKLFSELTSATREMEVQSARLDHAYDLMASPYQVSDFVLNLGRTLPSNMRVDRIESSQDRIALSGDLRERSEAAGGALNRYLEELRRSPAIGPLFSSIGLTSLQREADPDLLAFEITFRLKAPQP